MALSNAIKKIPKN